MALPELKPAEQKNLILDSLEIKNFRAFRHLQIPKLGRINLITGKNDVGKTSLLEGLQLYAENGSPSVLWRLLNVREELGAPLTFVSPFGFRNAVSEKPDGAAWLPYVPSLFHGRKSIYNDLGTIEIVPSGLNRHALTVEVGWFNDLRVPDGNNTARTELLRVTGENQDEESLSAKLYLMIQAGGRPKVSFAFDRGFYGTLYWAGLEMIRNRFVSAQGLERPQIIEIWDRVSLTDAEQDVISALSLINENIERVNLIAEAGGTGERVPFVKVSNYAQPIPLRSLGDGVNRLFGLTLALVSVKDGFLLLDEVENGLHYSVLPKGLGFLFQVARRLNVQVFATTHSWDCVQAFQIAAEEDEQDEGVLIRLQKKKGDVVATTFDEQELAIITREQIEVR